MKIEFKAPGKLIPFEKNVKTHTQKHVEELAESIKMFGFIQPVVVDESNHILIGHRRVKAAILLKKKTIPVTVKADLAYEEKIALCTYDNTSTLETGFDNEKVKAILLELKALDFPISDLNLEFKGVNLENIFDEEEHHSYPSEMMKQVMLFFTGEDYPEVVDQIDKIKTEKKLENNTEAVLFLINFWEKFRVKDAD